MISIEMKIFRIHLNECALCHIFKRQVKFRYKGYGVLKFMPIPAILINRRNACVFY